MSFFARFLLNFCVLFLGALIAALFIPAGWVAPKLAHLSQNAIQLHATEGTIARGGGLLMVTELGLRAPVRWQIPDGFGASVYLGGGHARLTPNRAEIITPIAMAINHVNVKSNITIAKGATLLRSAGALTAQGNLTSPQILLSLPLPATLTNANVTISPDGTWKLSAEGDVRVQGNGSLHSLAPPKGSAQIDLTPQAANPALETLIRRNVPADSSGRLRLNRNF